MDRKMRTISLRSGRIEDALELRRGMTEGFESYRSFAPPGWDPAGSGASTDRIRASLVDPAVWFLIAEAEVAIVGHIAVRFDEPASSAHVHALFVTPALWGSGLANRLHDAAVAQMRLRHVRRGRLWAAAGAARARRFYEREGWQPHGEPRFEPAFGIDLIDYQLDLVGDREPE
jgi:GNAT superfamily N-acetyltransferase